MISQSGKSTLQRFVTQAKQLLVENVTSLLQQYYGIWQDGHSIPVSQLTSDDVDVIHTAKLLRERLKHIKSSLPSESSDKDVVAVRQLISEQAYTTLNRFCALRMCEERDLIMQSVKNGYQSEGFVTYDMVTGQGALGDQYHRYKMYLQSVFDELSVELPSIFDRYSPYGLVFPDENALLFLLNLVNGKEMSEFYDESIHSSVNFWLEDETLGWIFQFYNSVEERKQMRNESSKPRNSREMAVRNQFFTPEFVVRFLTDNTLGRIWYEMTNGSERITEFCKYLVYQQGEEIPKRQIKEPTEITTLDPTCGSMHFGIYAYEVYEVIYLDAWDNHPELLQEYRWNTRDDFRKMIPGLILEHNLYGCEIDPRALQIAALSLWLRAQRSYSVLGLAREQRPVILKSNLVLAEPMPGNSRLLSDLFSGVNLPMRKLIRKIWETMKFVGEAGLLIKLEQIIAQELETLHKDWAKINAETGLNLFSSQEEIQEILKLPKLNSKESRNKFFESVMSNLKMALISITQRLSENEGYDNALFAEDALRGIAFIEMCYRRYDVIVMNPPFGEGSKSTISYFNKNYKFWCKNLVCAFFERMEELLDFNGRLGAIFDRTVFIKQSYVNFRKNFLCGKIKTSADTGWNVLDANVETATVVISNSLEHNNGFFYDLRTLPLEDKEKYLALMVNTTIHRNEGKGIYLKDSRLFEELPNSIIGYNIGKEFSSFFQNSTISDKGHKALGGFVFLASRHYRLFYEVEGSRNFSHVCGGGKYTVFYMPYRDMTEWIDNGKIAETIPAFRSTNSIYQKSSGVSYGERGEIIDAQIMKKGFFFTHERLGFIGNDSQSYICLSYVNSTLAQYAINLYSGQHKMNTYMNLLPMPDYTQNAEMIINLTKAIIDIKRFWFSLDETNLEYRGFIRQVAKKSLDNKTWSDIQNKVTQDFNRYQELLKETDEIWLDSAQIKVNNEVRDIIKEYNQKRPYEELLSIDKASNKNKIVRRVLTCEVLQELAGIAFGRWDVRYTVDEKQMPQLSDVFDALPFTPIVALNEQISDYPLDIPLDGILTSEGKLSIVGRVRQAMRYIWHNASDDIEYEICNWLKINDLSDYFGSSSGFFSHHFMRYTKSKRKAPIYWPLSSPNGTFIVWVYYPRLSENTLPAIVLLLNNEISSANVELQRASANGNKTEENRLRSEISDLQQMVDELNAIITLPYKPNQDDGVPVTAAPLRNLFQHRAWRNECQSNWEELNSGEYDWSHLAYAMFPDRIRQKAKKDWCMALTHGLEELCENKPKPKRQRKSSTSEAQQLGIDFIDNE